MSALERLHEKIEQLKTDYVSIQEQNKNLKSQLAGVAAAHTDQETLVAELRAELEQCTAKEQTIRNLQQELQEKDNEIEKIIAQVESLLA
jgi:predicted RNase H-like nuclease (RuvC/YqgF family)